MQRPEHSNGKSSPAAAVLVVGPLELRLDERSVTLAGQRLALTVREFQVLAELARRRERVVGRPELYAAVWRSDFRHDDRSVDVYVSKVRAKLEAALPGWTYIHTHFGFGYRLSPQPLHDFHRSLTDG